MVGVGRTVMGAVPSLSCPASQVPQCCYSIRDGGAVTGVSEWDPGHIYCGSGGLTPPVLSAVAEWPRARRRCVARSRVPRGALERGGDCPAGPSGTLERGGDCSAGSRGMRMGRTLGFFESFAFFQAGRRPWAFVGPTALIGVCIFKAILVRRLGCP